MIDRRLSALASTLFLVAMCALAGCASEPEKKDRTLRKAEKAKPAVEVKEPSPEELAGSPCGNPDWAQLPVGAEDKAPSQQPDQQPNEQPEPEQAPADDTGEEDPAQETEEQSQRGGLYPNDSYANKKPCT